MKGGFFILIFAICAVPGSLACDQVSIAQAMACYAGAMSTLQSAMNQLSSGSITHTSLRAACERMAVVWFGELPRLKIIPNDASDREKTLLDQIIACMNNALASCGPQHASLTGTVDGILTTLRSVQSTSCTKAFACVANFTTCVSNFPQIMSSPNVNDVNYCEGLLDFIVCVRAIDASCLNVPNITYYFRILDSLQFACQQTACQGVHDCVADFTAAYTSGDGLSLTECSAYEVYSNCLNTNLPSCGGDSVATGRNLARGSTATYIRDICNRLEVGNMFGCDAFSSCYENIMAEVDNLSPDKICTVVQKTTGCMAAAAADSECYQAGLVEDANNCMLRMADQACGVPSHDLAECSDLETCRDNLIGSANPDEITYCAACSAGRIQEFQNCAFDSMETCDLESTYSPSLSELAGLSGRLCAVLADEALCACNDMLACSVNKTFPPMNGLLSTFHWCKVTEKVVECATMYADTCGISQASIEELEDIRADSKEFGCMEVQGGRCSFLMGTGGTGVRHLASLLPVVLVAGLTRVAIGC